jgi:hypothetical protein
MHCRKAPRQELNNSRTTQGRNIIHDYQDLVHRTLRTINNDSSWVDDQSLCVVAGGGDERRETILELVQRLVHMYIEPVQVIPKSRSCRR